MENKERKIPKLVHYCWFGNGEKPPIIKNCLNSWYRHLGDYEIHEWNQENFDLKRFPFAERAYRLKKYAFVTDVVRLAVLKEYGGIYMDSDVEVVRSLNRFLSHRAFTGHETSDLMVTATMGAEKNHPWISMLLDYYEGRPYSEKTNTQIITELSSPLVERKVSGFRYLKDGVVIYPVHTFANYDHKRFRKIPHADAYAYHLYAGSWKR